MRPICRLQTPLPPFSLNGLIRPMPKKTIKSRLSQDAVDSIQYPPTLPSTSLPPYSHYGENGEYSSDSKILVHQHDDGYDHDHDHSHDHDDDHDCPHHHHCHHDEYEDDLDSQDERMAPSRHYFVSSPRSPRSGRSRYTARGSMSGRMDMKHSRIQTTKRRGRSRPRVV